MCIAAGIGPCEDGGGGVGGREGLWIPEGKKLEWEIQGSCDSM